MTGFDLKAQGITVEDIGRNVAPPILYEEAIRIEPDSRIAASGAFVAYSGAKTGRSPKTSASCEQPPSEADVWWGNVNLPLGG